MKPYVRNHVPIVTFSITKLLIPLLFIKRFEKGIVQTNIDETKVV